MAYRLLRWFLRIVSRVFFRQVEIVGLENIPAGPVLFAGNHPNSLIDPMLIITTCGRAVYFAAKDTLFKRWLMRAVLRGLHAVPIARRDDHGGGAGVDNASAFGALFEVIAAGGAIGIFPEGLSHDDAQLARLKTGAARLALGGASQTGRSVAIVPCGLTFIHPKRFRSRVLVQYGTAITVAPERPDTPDEVRALTTELDAALRRLTINAPDWDTVRALDVVRRLYQPHAVSIEDRVELARRFNTYYPAVADDPRVIRVMERVRAYQLALDELGVTDRELSRDLTKREISTRMVGQLLLIAFWLPLTTPGAPLLVPALVFARLASGRFTPRQDVIATTKMVIGMLLVTAAYAGTIAAAWWRAGVWAALALAIVLPLSGWATLRVLDRVRLVQRGFGVLLRRLRFRIEVNGLREERAALVAMVTNTASQVRPADLPQMWSGDETTRDRRNEDLDDELDRADRR